MRPDPPALSVVWGRDGRGPPEEGAPGDLVVAREDALARTLRARAPDGARLAVEIERDVVDPGVLPAAWGGAGNAVLAAIWHRRVAAAAADPDRLPPSAGAPGEAWPPLLLCREKGKVFRPPSPVTALPDALADCRDEDLLRHARLPSWSATTQRVLYDARVARGAGTRFWSAAPSPPRSPSVEVGNRERFARDLARVLDALAAGAAPPEVRASFPCATCTEVPRCFARAAPGVPQPPHKPLAPSRLVPVTFYPAHVLVHREEVLDFGEHCDLLGGATWTQFRSRNSPAWKHAGTRVVREGLESEVTARIGAVAPVAAFRAKLTLFASVVDAVVACVRALGAPHLGLSPARVVAHRLAPLPDGRFDVSVRGALRSVPLGDLMPAPPGPPLWLPPPEPSEPYAHADLVRDGEPASTAPSDGPGVHEGGFRYGRYAPVKVKAGRVWTDDDAGTSQFELEVSGLGDALVAAQDLVRIVLQEEGWKGVVLWARRDEERTSAEGIPVRALPVALTSGQVLDLGAAKRKAMFGTAAVFRTYGPHYDVHALGMLLARALLENSAQSVAQAARDAIPAIATFAAAVRSGARTTPWDELVTVIEGLVAQSPHSAVLSDANVCFDPREARTSRDRVPPRLWAEALATVGVCVATGGRIAIAPATRLTGAPDELTAPLEALGTRVRSILDRLPPPAPRAAPQNRDDAPARESPTAVVADFEVLPVPELVEEEAVPGAPDPRDARIAELETALAAAVARASRVEEEVAALLEAKARLEAEARPSAPAPVAVDLGPWRYLHDAVSGTKGAPLRPPKPGDPAVDVVHAALVEGLTTISAMQQAVAELGGQEFAAEQRNVERMVRTALQAAAKDAPDARARADETVAALRALRAQLGTAIAGLVEAHGVSSREGVRALVLTLSVAAKKELDLDARQEARLADLVARMNAGLAELVGRLFEPRFQQRVRELIEQHRTRKEGR